MVDGSAGDQLTATYNQSIEVLWNSQHLSSGSLLPVCSRINHDTTRLRRLSFSRICEAIGTGHFHMYSRTQLYHLFWLLISPMFIVYCSNFNKNQDLSPIRFHSPSTFIPFLFPKQMSACYSPVRYHLWSSKS